MNNLDSSPQVGDDISDKNYNPLAKRYTHALNRVGFLVLIHPVSDTTADNTDKHSIRRMCVR